MNETTSVSFSTPSAAIQQGSVSVLTGGSGSLSSKSIADSMSVILSCNPVNDGTYCPATKTVSSALLRALPEASYSQMPDNTIATVAGEAAFSSRELSSHLIMPSTPSFSHTIPRNNPTADVPARPTSRETSETVNSNQQALAGVAMGCLIAGIIFGGTIALLLLTYRRKKRGRAVLAVSHTRSSSRASEPGTKSVAAATAIALSSIGSASSITYLAFLPAAASDAEVQARVQGLVHQIHEFVDSIYRDRRVSLDNQLEEAIEDYETCKLGTPLVTLFQRSANSTVLIKHCLTYHILNLTLCPGQGVSPFLPREYASIVADTYYRIADNKLSRDHLIAFSLWKRLTSYLTTLTRHQQGHPHPYQPQNQHETHEQKHLDSLSTPKPKQEQEHLAFAAKFTETFKTYSKHIDNNNLDLDFDLDDGIHRDIAVDSEIHPQSRYRTTHLLTQILGSASATAEWIFSQPENYRFDWTVRSDQGQAGTEHGRCRNRFLREKTVGRKREQGRVQYVKEKEIVVVGPEVRRSRRVSRESKAGVEHGEEDVLIAPVTAWVYVSR